MVDFHSALIYLNTRERNLKERETHILLLIYGEFARIGVREHIFIFDEGLTAFAKQTRFGVY